MLEALSRETGPLSACATCRGCFRGQAREYRRAGCGRKMLKEDTL